MKDNVYLYCAVTTWILVYLTQVCWLGVESQDMFYTNFSFVSTVQSLETPAVPCNIFKLVITFSSQILMKMKQALGKTM